MKPEEISCFLIAGNSKSEWTLSKVVFSKKERVLRALKTGGIATLVTALTVAVPVAHFILVPLGVLLIPILAWLSFRTQSQLVGAKISCPECRADFELSTRRFAAQMFANCPTCSREVEVRIRG